jgi:hypothetical protein
MAQLLEFFDDRASGISGRANDGNHGVPSRFAGRLPTGVVPAPRQATKNPGAMPCRRPGCRQVNGDEPDLTAIESCCSKNRMQIAADFVLTHFRSFCPQSRHDIIACLIS